MKGFDIRWAALTAVATLLLGSWYWYEYRPQRIKEDCAQYMARVSAATAGSPDIEETGDAYLKILNHMQLACEDAGGAANFENSLQAGQQVSHTD